MDTCAWAWCRLHPQTRTRQDACPACSTDATGHTAPIYVCRCPPQAGAHGQHMKLPPPQPFTPGSPPPRLLPLQGAASGSQTPCSHTQARKGGLKPQVLGAGIFWAGAGGGRGAEHRTAEPCSGESVKDCPESPPAPPRVKAPSCRCPWAQEAPCPTLPQSWLHQSGGTRGPDRCESKTRVLYWRVEHRV